LEDPYLIDERGKVWIILEIPYAVVKEAEEQYRRGVITSHGLFTKMINAWKSITKGNPEELCDILEGNGFKLSAGK
jgi:hypothetical protein